MSSLSIAAKTIWNQESYQELRSTIRRCRPAVCHFHNTFPLISPAAFYAARAEGVPVVVTIHNYRLACPGVHFLRDGRPCEDCIGKLVAWPGILHACYRRSRVATAGVAALSATHRMFGTWKYAVDRYIALTGFAKQKLIQAGIASTRIIVKPNFITPDPGFSETPGSCALFVGRLGPEKGIETLIAAWRVLRKRVPLRIVGDGPLARFVAEAARDIPAIEWVGRLDRAGVNSEMQNARFLVFPSVCYEGLPLTLIEAFAVGLPVIASNLGSVPEMVEHGRMGFLFRPGDSGDLAATIESALENSATLAGMRVAARQKYEDCYTGDKNYLALLQVYRSAIASKEPAAPGFANGAEYSA